MITTTKRLNEVQARLDKATKDLEAAETLNKEMQSKCDELSKRITELENLGEIKPEAFETVKEALAEAMTELEKTEDEKKAVEAKAEQLEVKQENFKSEVSEKALEIAASQGIPPIDVKPVADATATATGGDLIAQLTAIKDPVKQRAFWLANKDALMVQYFGVKK